MFPPQNTYRPHQLKTILFLVLVFLGSVSLAQVKGINGDTLNAVDGDNPITSVDSKIQTPTTPELLPNQVNIFFTNDKMELKKGEIISNVLSIINKTAEEQIFMVDILFPAGWMNLTDNKAYKLLPGEKIFVPIILIPQRMMNSNTEIIINTFLVNQADEQLAAGYFTMFTKKLVSWESSIEEGSRLYFRNGETEKDFNYSVMNTGNFSQDILISHKANDGELILKDTNNFVLKDRANTISLLPGHDTTITYRATTSEANKRNFRKVSLQNHNPNSNLNFKKHTVYINSTEPKGLGSDIYKKGNKVDIVKLPNHIKASPYGYPNLPLTVEANVQNVLSDFTFMSINMRGFKQINENASIAYFTQLNYSQAYWNEDILKTVPWYVGYYDRKTTVEVGQVSGNLIGVYNYGQGIKASHAYAQKQKTSAFYVRDPSMFKEARTESFGVGHEFKLSEDFKITGKVGRGINNQTNTIIDVATINPSFNIKKKFFFNFMAAGSKREVNAPGRNLSVEGFLLGANFSTNYFKKKVKTSLSGRYNDPNFSYGALERLTGTHRTSISVKPDLNIYINNNYQNMVSFNTTGNNIGYTQEMMYNNVIFSKSTRLGTFQPGIFYNISDYLANRVHSRGLSFRFSNFDFQKNILSSFFLKAGYNDPIDIPVKADYFTFEMSGLIRYKVWNFSLKYNYGALSTNALVNMQREGVTPQSFRVSVQNQYQFKNPHYLLENSVMYNYNNRFDGHNIGLYPQFYYFTNSGWRYGVEMNLNYASSNYASIYDSYNLNNAVGTDRGANVNSNVNVNISIRKEFGIPVPFAKKHHATNTITAFYDVNGNHMHDKDEPTMENIIIRIKGNEVITNAKGEAEIANMPVGRYPISIIALDKMEGWFPDLSDSITILNSGQILIPFMRGVKVYGDVILDRQKIAIADKDKVFDMSRIKVTAIGGRTYNTLTDIDGHFEFYLPNGEYTLTMDETILGDTYKLSKNNIPLTLKSSQDGVYMSFYIVEKRRKVEFKTF
ncbi:MAG: hypothetical protein ACI85Q_001615 [Salibacteraceae bacterium]|jgi:hypothetical protein